MRFSLILGIGIAAAWFVTGAQAQNYPWCAHYDKGDGGMNCGFTTFQQCLIDLSGLGGFCEQNNTYVLPAAAPAPKHHPPKNS
jgi:Protein of unknown function (DUF3551)